MNAFSYVLTTGLVALVVACSGGPDNTPTTSSSSSSGGGSSKSPSSTQERPSEETDPTESTSGSTTPSKPSGATNVSCTTADDCGNWFCDCADSNGRVSPVNSRNCKNGWCLDAASSCPSACSAFGKKWTGTAGGGPDQ